MTRGNGDVADFNNGTYYTQVSGLTTPLSDYGGGSGFSVNKEGGSVTGASLGGVSVGSNGAVSMSGGVTAQNGIVTAPDPAGGTAQISNGVMTRGNGDVADFNKGTYYTQANGLTTPLSDYGGANGFSVNKEGGSVTGASLGGVSVGSNGAVSMGGGVIAQNGIISAPDPAGSTAKISNSVIARGNGDIADFNKGTYYSQSTGQTAPLGSYGSGEGFGVNREGGNVTGASLGSVGIGSNGSVSMGGVTAQNGIVSVPDPAGGTAQISNGVIARGNGDVVDINKGTYYTAATGQTMPLGSFSGSSATGFSVNKEGGHVTGAVLDGNKTISADGTIQTSDGTTYAKGQAVFPYKSSSTGALSFGVADTNARTVGFSDGSYIDLGQGTYTSGSTGQITPLGSHGAGDGFSVNKENGKVTGVTLGGNLQMGNGGTIRSKDGLYSAGTFTYTDSTGGTSTAANGVFSRSNGDVADFGKGTYYSESTGQTTPLSGYSGGDGGFSVRKDGGSVVGASIGNVSIGSNGTVDMGGGVTSHNGVLSAPDPDGGTAKISNGVMTRGNGDIANFNTGTYYTQSTGQTTPLADYGGGFSVAKEGGGIAGASLGGVSMDSDGAVNMGGGTSVKGNAIYPTPAFGESSGMTEISGRTVSFSDGSSINLDAGTYADKSGHETSLSNYSDPANASFSVNRDSGNNLTGVRLANGLSVGMDGTVTMGNGSSVQNGTVTHTDGSTFTSGPSGGTYYDPNISATQTSDGVRYAGGISVDSGGRVQTKSGSTFETAPNGIGYNISEQGANGVAIKTSPSHSSITGGSPSNSISIDYGANTSTFSHSTVSYSSGGSASIQRGNARIQSRQVSIAQEGGQQSTLSAYGERGSFGFQYRAAGGDSCLYTRGQPPVVHSAGGEAVAVGTRGYRMSDGAMVTSKGEIIQGSGASQTRAYLDSSQARPSVKVDFGQGSSRETLDLTANSFTHSNKSVTNLTSGTTDLRMGKEFIGSYDGKKQMFNRFDSGFDGGKTPVSISAMNSSYNSRENILAATNAKGEGRIFMNVRPKQANGGKTGFAKNGASTKGNASGKRQP